MLYVQNENKSYQNYAIYVFTIDTHSKLAQTLESLQQPRPKKQEKPVTVSQKVTNDS